MVAILVTGTGMAALYKPFFIDAFCTVCLRSSRKKGAEVSFSPRFSIGLCGNVLQGRTCLGTRSAGRYIGSAGSL